jgi:V8-like Glu-specific endopeptidase
MPTASQPNAPKVYLAASPTDSETVKELYHRLKQDGAQPWFAPINLLPGQNTRYETQKAMSESRYVLICISAASVGQSGNLQRELKQALDLADEQPEGQIHTITVRLDECTVPFSLRETGAADYFKPNGYALLLQSLGLANHDTEPVFVPPALPSPPQPQPIHNPTQERQTMSKSQPLNRHDRQRLADLLLNLDQLFNAPRPFLMEIGLPRPFVMSLNLPPNSPAALASTVVERVENYGILPDGSKDTALAALIERLLTAGLSPNDKDFLQKLLVNNRLLVTPQLDETRGLEGILPDEKQAERWRDASFLYKGAQRLRAVCRVETESDGLGTGFLVAPDLVLTNSHVLAFAPGNDPETQAANLRFRFGYIADGNNVDAGQPILPLSGGQIMVASSPIYEYDFVLLRLAEPIGTKLGYLTIESRELVPGEEVFILQHPAGWEMKFMVGKTAEVTTKRINYTVNTLGGTSGSPVFDSNWKLVALHKGDGLDKKDVNRGIPMSSIRPLVQKFLPI